MDTAAVSPRRSDLRHRQAHPAGGDDDGRTSGARPDAVDHLAVQRLRVEASLAGEHDVGVPEQGGQADGVRHKTGSRDDLSAQDGRQAAGMPPAAPIPAPLSKAASSAPVAWPI